MAQFGSALDWGSSGRRFKSCQPDAGQTWFLATEIRFWGGLTQTFDPNQLPSTVETRLLIVRVLPGPIAEMVHLGVQVLVEDHLPDENKAGGPRSNKRLVTEGTR